MLKGSALESFPVKEFEKLPLLETRRTILSYLRYIRAVNEQGTYTSAEGHSLDVPEQLRKIFERVVFEDPDEIHKGVLQMLASLKRILSYFYPISNGISQEEGSDEKRTDLELLNIFILDRIRNHQNVVVSSMFPCDILCDSGVNNEGSIAYVLYKDEQDILRTLCSHSLRIRKMNGMLLTTYKIITDSLTMIVKNYNLTGLSRKVRNDIKSVVFRMTNLCSSITDIGDYLFLSWVLTSNMRTEIPQCVIGTKHLNIIPYEGDIRFHIQNNTMLSTFQKDNTKVFTIKLTKRAIYILAKMLKSIPCDCLESVTKDPNFMFLSKKASISSIEVIKELKKVVVNTDDCQESEKRIGAAHPLVFTARMFVNNVLELISVIETLAFDRMVCPKIWLKLRKLKTVILETGRMILWINQESKENSCINSA